MAQFPTPLDLKKLKVYPLAKRSSMARIDDILIRPEAPPPACSDWQKQVIQQTSEKLVAAKKRGASVLFMYGAHLVKNGASLLVEKLMAEKWVTHLATNGAGAIHDWEFAFQAWSTESVEKNVATGTFGTWDETGRNIHLALLAGALRSEGFGVSLGRHITEDGVTLPSTNDLEKLLSDEPTHPLTPARADLLLAMRQYSLAAGRIEVKHPWKHTSIFA